MNKREKITSMLTSADRELVTLGSVLALNEGKAWCKKNIPYFGPRLSSINPRRHDILASKMLKPKQPMEPCVCLKKGNLAMMIGWDVDCRMLKHFDRDEQEMFKDVKIDEK